MVWDHSIQDMNTNTNNSLFVMRNFLVGDRVVSYFNKEFQTGTVLERIVRCGDPWVLIKTDNLVDSESGALLGGYGIMSPFYPKELLYFEGESLPRGDTIYQKWIRWPMTKEEIDEANEPLPF